MIIKYIRLISLLLLSELLVSPIMAQHRDVKIVKNGPWRVEFEYPEKSYFRQQSDEWILSSHGGATLWLDSLLEGDYEISYKRMVLVDTGATDRLSDLNQFWLTREPAEDPLVTTQLKARDGRLASYDSLDLFYVGMGGNNNTTTRFRKYDGTGKRMLLQEKNEAMYLLLPNRYYNIRTIVSASGGFTSFYVDGRLVFQYQGIIPTRGFFGFRQTASRQKIKDLQIYKLKNGENKR